MSLPGLVNKHSIHTVNGVDSPNYPSALRTNVFVNVVSCAVMDWHGVSVKPAGTIFIECYCSC